ncbi:MAG: helix-turn-helix domain-containing protein [Deltaproteobacteria bacterium]|nr:helix-turn-helix domain-containing protein [Deltaproteobacteria bacterium]
MQNKDRILQALEKYGELSSSQLVEKTGIHLSNVSRYCNKLFREGMLKKRIENRTRYYQLTGQAPIPQPKPEPKIVVQAPQKNHSTTKRTSTRRKIQIDKNKLLDLLVSLNPKEKRAWKTIIDRAKGGRSSAYISQLVDVINEYLDEVCV